MSVGFIMAGGVGKRLWPESRLNHPKQFLSLRGKDSLLQLTYRRCVNLFGSENSFIVTREELKEKIASHLPSCPPEHILGEPAGRDTAPCIGFAAVYMKKKKKNACMVTLPSDHLVEDTEKFNKVIQAAIEFAQNGYLVTVGIKPTRAETGYGYIQAADKIGEFEGIPCCKLERFTEKPSQKKAKEFMENGNFLWNAGIFAWSPDTILGEIKKYLPPLHEGLEKIGKALETDKEKEVLREVYPKLPRISIDYAVMEKTHKAVVIPGEFMWDDIGEWRALERIFSKNERNNIIQGLVKEVGTENCIFVNREDKIMGVLGVSNMIVVNCQGGTLVISKEMAPRVKELVDELLEDENLKKYAE